MSQLKFSGNQSAFYADLKERVNQYFAKRNKGQHGDHRIYFKAGILLTTFFATFILLVFFTPPIWFSILLCIVLGLATAGIGFNVMHDGSHGSFSSSRFVNRLATLTLNFLGASSYFWNIKHVVVHHTFTNIDGHDDDIQNEPFLRMCNSQKKLWIHRFQHIHWIFMYGLTYTSWVFYLDFKKYFSRKIAAKENIQMPLINHFGFWITKAAHVFIFFVLPLIFLPLSYFIIGYIIFSFTTGFVTSVIFQLAHAVEDTEFMEVKAEQKILENDWAIHQVKTTSNFATRSKLITFFAGGLNFQIEHHLFPKVSHVFYPELSVIVRDVCAKYGITYGEHRTLALAIVSHVRFLKKMGR
jgi:linoleoyl-CoA desaturase